MWLLRGLFAAVILSLGITACTKRQQETGSENDGPGAGVAIQPVESLGEPGLQDLVKNRNGKVLLLNVWATWCQPCVEEFPDLVRLANNLKDKNVEVVGLSVDYPDEIGSKVLPFLRSHNVSFKVYVENFKDEERFINSLNTKWNGAIPATFIFDAEGNQRAFLIGQQDYKTFKMEVESVREKS